jgi:ketosteroid isomerase-like protein
MMEQNKYTLSMANQAIESGDYETFLSLCTEDTHWNFVGERTLVGKEAVRDYFREVYHVPPVFDVRRMFAEGDHVIAMGSIRLADRDGVQMEYEYCDVWELRGGKLHGLKAYVIEPRQK